MDDLDGRLEDDHLAALNGPAILNETGDRTQRFTIASAAARAPLGILRGWLNHPCCSLRVPGRIGVSASPLPAGIARRPGTRCRARFPALTNRTRTNVARLQKPKQRSYPLLNPAEPLE